MIINNCFSCRQRRVHKHLLKIGFIGKNCFNKLKKLWLNCECYIKNVN